MDKEQIIAMGRTYVDGSDAGILFFANALLNANRKQGADARPVAIYQFFVASQGWIDISKESYETAERVKSEGMRRIVYATRDAAPSDAPIVAWIVEGRTGKSLVWDSEIGGYQRAGLTKTPLIAAIAPREKT